MRCIGDPEGDRPLEPGQVRRPLELASLEAVRTQLERLIGEIGMAADFLITGLVQAGDAYLQRAIEERERNRSMFEALQRRFETLREDPEAAAAYLDERGLGPADLDAMLDQLAEQIARIEDPAWESERRRDLDAWRRATAGLLDPCLRLHWEGKRFQEAGRAVRQFFSSAEE